MIFPSAISVISYDMLVSVWIREMEFECPSFSLAKGHKWLLASAKKLAQPFANGPLQLRRSTR
ncbi:hypothetical protein RB6702 [Rhodopirellula baltica SH 1]|uniref:Uncharacterized protein n=1 Tax=Rhodopirellula baltica (strain DSM 10527 / NCIMB 13988 / SH1) TaxID=243090 RepID=Q7UPV2_RHOBA|nr:hypothetical protein RB6702 [Rhodopirellula baltica SH 1]